MPTHPVADRIHTLLYTMRTIERYEDRLCSMLDEIKRSNRVSPELNAELQALVDDLPSHEYQYDLDALRDLLAA